MCIQIFYKYIYIQIHILLFLYIDGAIFQGIGRRIPSSHSQSEDILTLPFNPKLGPPAHPNML